MSVSLVEVMAAASRRLAPLSGECAGHAVLAAADQLLANPRVVGAADVLIEDNGSVRLGHGRARDGRGCDAALRELLDGLLAVAHSGGAGLLRIGRRTATGDLAQLVKELEVALIPANRAAARRSLARLYRETSRAREAGSLSVPAPPAAAESPPATAAFEPSVAPLVPEAPAAPLVPEPAALRLASSEVDEPLAVTQIRWATATRGVAAEPPSEFDLEVELELEVDLDTAITPALSDARHTQPLPKVEPRQRLHETVPLPPVTSRSEVTEHVTPLEPVLPLVSPRARVTEHETPLEPVLNRRHTGPPGVRREFPDIHQTPYLGTQVSAVPRYDDARSREPWPLPSHAPLEAPSTACDPDESTTDPAPVVAWSALDEEPELDEAALPNQCPALAVEPRVSPPAACKEPRVFRPSEVEELVERFQIAEPEPDPQLARSLKQLAGITTTPPPVHALSDNVPPSPEPQTSVPCDAGAALRPKPTMRIAGS